MRRYLLILISTLCVCVCMYAQEAPQAPDLQTADGNFFDPTRKQEKVREVYKFKTEYRLEVGYNQSNQRTRNLTYPDMYIHGLRVGTTFTFLLPINFSLQTGVLFNLGFGVNEQHWRSQTQASAQPEYLKHNVLQFNLVIPVRAYYTIPVWKQLNLFFYGGPQLNFTLAEHDFINQHLSPLAQKWLTNEGIRTEQYDRVWTGELYHTNVQLGVGGGLEWDKYRLQAGYDFGLNNRIKSKMISNQHMWEWSWYVSFSYKF